jgi:hypothetical protein
VRMLVAGRSPSEIAALVRTSEVDFDLSEEMLVELRSAGVSEELLAVMRARQEETRPAPEPASEPERPARQLPRPGLPTVEVTLAVAPSRIFHPDRLEDAQARPLGVGPKPAQRRVEDLAVFVLCTSADHVPDHWRSASPLGQDGATPRHQLLAFHEGAARVERRDVSSAVRRKFPEPRGDEPAPGWLALEIPPLTLALESGVAHDLAFGVAVRMPDGWRIAAQAERPGYLPRAGEEIPARIAQGKAARAPLEVSLVELQRDQP